MMPARQQHIFFILAADSIKQSLTMLRWDDFISRAL